MWEREASLDFLALTEFLDTQGKVGPGADLAMTAATGPGVMPACRAPQALMASPALLDPKDQRDRKGNHTHCLKKNVADTEVKPESLGWSASRDLLVAPGLWDPWVQLVLQDDRAPLDPQDLRDNRATEGSASMERRGKRVM